MQPASMPEEITLLLLALRQRRPRRGPKKLRGFLTRDRPDLSWPAASTIGDLLRREGLVTPRRVRARGVEQIQPHSMALAPNEIWGIDFKGWFRTRDGTRCDPLTVSDVMSRYLLLCEIVAPTLEGVWPACQRLFAEHGQPRAFRDGQRFAVRLERRRRSDEAFGALDQAGYRVGADHAGPSGREWAP
jgi:hypothetical protein